MLAQSCSRALLAKLAWRFGGALAGRRRKASRSSPSGRGEARGGDGRGATPPQRVAPPKRAPHCILGEWATPPQRVAPPKRTPHRILVALRLGPLLLRLERRREPILHPLALAALLLRSRQATARHRHGRRRRARRVRRVHVPNGVLVRLRVLIDALLRGRLVDALVIRTRVRADGAPLLCGGAPLEEPLLHLSSALLLERLDEIGVHVIDGLPRVIPRLRSSQIGARMRLAWVRQRCKGAPALHGCASDTWVRQRYMGAPVIHGCASDTREKR